MRWIRSAIVGVWCAICCALHLWRDPLSMLSMLADWIEERRQRRRANKNNAKILEVVNVLKESGVAAIFLCRYRYFYINEPAARMYGMSTDELIGKSPSELSPYRQPDGQGSKEKAVAAMNRAQKTGKPVRIPWMATTTDGPLRIWVTVSYVFSAWGSDYHLAIKERMADDEHWPSEPAPTPSKPERRILGRHLQGVLA